MPRRAPSSSAQFSPYLAGNNGVSGRSFHRLLRAASSRLARQRGGNYHTADPETPARSGDGRSRPLPSGLARRADRRPGRQWQSRPLSAARAEIERGALDAKQLGVLLGRRSGRGVFPASPRLGPQSCCADGSIVRLGYDGQNGQAYVAIGTASGRSAASLRSDEVSLPSIRAWMTAHPRAGAGLMDEIRLTCFFARSARRWPRRREGVVLTPGRSLAVDRNFLPARRAGLSRSSRQRHRAAASHGGAGYGRRDRRPGPGRRLLGFRRCRPKLRPEPCGRQGFIIYYCPRPLARFGSRQPGERYHGIDQLRD